MDDDSHQPKKLESHGGGSGRPRKTAIGNGGAGSSGGGPTESESSPGDEPSFGDRPTAVICLQNLHVRAGMSVILNRHLNVVDHTDDANLFPDLINEHKPHLVITDTNLSLPNPVSYIESIIRGSGQTNLIIFADTHRASRYYRSLLDCKVRFICLQKSFPVSLVAAVKASLTSERGTFIDPVLMNLVEQPLFANLLSDYKLSATEFNVFLRLDLRNSEIASELKLTAGQVQLCIEALCAKLHVPTRTALALKVVQNGGVLLPKISERDPVTNDDAETVQLQKICSQAIKDWFDRYGSRPLRTMSKSGNSAVFVDDKYAKAFQVRADKMEGGIEGLKGEYGDLQALIMENKVLLVQAARR